MVPYLRARRRDRPSEIIFPGSCTLRPVLDLRFSAALAMDRAHKSQGAIRPGKTGSERSEIPQIRMHDNSANREMAWRGYLITDVRYRLPPAPSHGPGESAHTIAGQCSCSGGGPHEKTSPC